MLCAISVAYVGLRVNFNILNGFAGAFGKVFHGFLTNESDQTVEEVAIKTIKGKMCV